MYQLYIHLHSCPDNPDVPEAKALKEHTVSATFLHFLAMAGPFTSWKDEAADFGVSKLYFISLTLILINVNAS